MPQIALAPAFGLRGNFRQIVFADRFFKFLAQFRGLANVQHVEDRLLAEEHEAAQPFLIFGSHLHFAQRFFVAQVHVGTLDQLELFLEIRRLHLLEIFFQTLQPLFDLP